MLHGKLFAHVHAQCFHYIFLAYCLCVYSISFFYIRSNISCLFSLSSFIITCGLPNCVLIVYFLLLHFYMCSFLHMTTNSTFHFLCTYTCRPQPRFRASFIGKCLPLTFTEGHLLQWSPKLTLKLYIALNTLAWQVFEQTDVAYNLESIYLHTYFVNYVVE